MISQDKKIMEARFQFRGEPMNIKHYLIMIIMFILLLFLADSNYVKQSSYTIIAYIFLYFLLFIALKYNVNSKFYLVFLGLFVFVFLTTKNFDFIDWEDIDLSPNNLKKNNKK